MNHGLHRLRSGFPLSLRLIREIHGLLLTGGRGQERTPGEFRTSQNWIGGDRPGRATYVPPPPDELMDCLSAFERFLHTETPELPALVRAGLIHVQFESIHPFLDGNGRLGRLLIALMLCHKGVLRDPTLYLSCYFRSFRQQYYDLLQHVRTDGDWESWLAFYLEGVTATAQQVVETSERILDLIRHDRQSIASMGRRASAALRLFDCMLHHPISRLSAAADETKLSFPTVNKAAEALVESGVVRELTGRQRGRLYCYDEFVRILNEGTVIKANAPSL